MKKQTNVVNCRLCGLVLTDENGCGRAKKTGKLIPFCRECNNETCYERRWNSKSEPELRTEMARLAARYAILKRVMGE